MRKFIFALAICFAVPAQAQSGSAVTVYNKFVAEVGVHANMNVAFFKLRDGPSECKFQVIYVDLSGNGGRAAYAAVLSARRSEMALSWVTYVLQADGACTVDVVSG